MYSFIVIVCIPFVLGKIKTIVKYFSFIRGLDFIQSKYSKPASLPCSFFFLPVFHSVFRILYQVLYFRLWEHRAYALPSVRLLSGWGSWRSVSSWFLWGDGVWGWGLHLELVLWAERSGGSWVEPAEEVVQVWCRLDEVSMKPPEASGVLPTRVVTSFLQVEAPLFPEGFPSSRWGCSKADPKELASGECVPQPLRESLRCMQLIAINIESVWWWATLVRIKPGEGA